MREAWEGKVTLEGIEMVILEVRDVTKKFGGLVALDSFSLRVNQGEMVALIGPNGAGKTTVFNLITGFHRVDRGQVLLNHRSITGLKPHRICDLGLARTFQIVQPFLDMTVLENATIGALKKVKRVRDAMAKASEILEIAGILHLSSNKASSITLADRKRLELAKALATGPTVLLLDEVMAGLTPKETEQIISMVKRINGSGMTIVLIEHVIKAVVALATRIIVIDHGVKIAEGTASEALRDPRVIEAYLGKELEIA